MTEEEVQEKVREIVEGCAAWIKRIVVSKGRLEGNFYYVGNATGALAGLAVTTAAKDKKGTLVVKDGKELRKLIKGSKFARGRLVSNEGGVPIFELKAGNASPAMMIKGLRKTLSQEADLAFLKRSKVIRPDGQEETGEGQDASAPAREPLLSQAEQAQLAREMDELQAEQRLADLSQFLSQEDADRDQAELMQGAADQIRALQASNDPRKKDKINALRAELAQSLAVGDTSVEASLQPGEELPPALLEVLRTSVDAAEGALGGDLKRMRDELQRLHGQIQGMTVEERDAARERLTAQIQGTKAAVGAQLGQLRTYLLEDGE